VVREEQIQVTNESALSFDRLFLAGYVLLIASIILLYAVRAISNSYVGRDSAFVRGVNALSKFVAENVANVDPENKSSRGGR
jgi:hypothetical protein